MSTTTPNLSKHGLQNGGVGTSATTRTVLNVTNIPSTQTIQPNKGIVLAKNAVFKTMNSAVTKPAVMNDSERIEIKSENVQSSVQICTEDNKKIIISGAKSVKDIPANVLQQILSSVKNVKPNETILVLNNKKETSIQNKEVKSYESIVKDVLQNELPQNKAIDIGNAASEIMPEVQHVVPRDPLKNDTIVVREDVQKGTKTNNLINIVCREEKTIDKSNAKDLPNDEFKRSNSVNEIDPKFLRNDIKTNYVKTVFSKNQMNNSSIGGVQNNATKNNTADKVGTVEENNLKSNQEKNDQEKRSKVELSMKPILAVAPRQAPKPEPKQKKFLYRLKSKNGKVLSYVSDTHIVLKKPIICLDKMTQADAERLSRQFAEEKKNKLRKSSRLSNSTVDSNQKVDQVEKVDKDEKVEKNKKDDSTSDKSYGVQTRKRKLQFLPDGRIKKNRKSKIYDSSSSLSSLDDDYDDVLKPPLTSDEDYHEDVDLPVMSSDDDKDANDISVKSTNSKKITPPKKVLSENTLLIDNKVDVKTTSISKTLPNKINNLKNSTSAALQLKTISNARPVQNKVTVDAPTIFATLLKIPIQPNQLNVRRFKPKIQSTRGKTNNSFMFKKIFSPDLKQLIPLLKTNSQENTSFPSPSTAANKAIPKSVYNSPSIKLSASPHGTIWSHNNISQKKEYNAVSLDPPPLAPLSNRESPASRGINNHIFKTHRSPYQSTVNIAAKFEGFTNTKVVKTKDGPKKAMINQMKKSDEPITIYDIMEEIFDSMPHWNIHVIPENKSFCLAQISLGRTGIPVLKKSIEINSEFSAKVYVHQLHCKRYDGIYDTESKIRKLIQDVDSVAI